jgi:hypothetical protein
MGNDIRSVIFRAGQKQLSASDLNCIVGSVIDLLRGGGLVPGNNPAMLVQAQAEIAFGAIGKVKRAYYKDGSVSTIGDEFDAVNAGPSGIATNGVAIMSATGGETPFFIYSAENGVTGLSGTPPIISAEAGTAGTATTALRSNTIPGNQLVGSPGDVVDDTATLFASLEYVKKTDGTRRGQRARLYGSYAATKQPLGLDAAGLYGKVSASPGILQVSADGLTVPAPAAGDTFAGIDGAEISTGLTIDASFHDLDLTAIIGTNAKAVALQVFTPLSYSSWCKKGFSACARGIAGQYANIVIPTLAGVIQYNIPASNAYYTYQVLGYWGG